MPSFPLRVPSEVLLDEGRSETIKAGGHRRVGGEEVSRSRGGQRDFEGLPGLFHETAGALQHGEGRMPFIQMTDFRLDAQRASNRQPPIPRSSSCLRRNSGPPPYSSLVIPR
jgi:hypothetical protein